MITLRPLSGRLAALFAAGTVTLVSGHARAACATDADCGKGFACDVVATGGCTVTACPSGQTCPPSPPCDPVQIKECVPGPCNADADCADGMVCFASERTDCPVSPPTPACPPNTKCDVPPPDMGTCTTTTVKMCVPRYLLPCTTASDCGTGFDCVLDPPACWCSGSSGGGSPAPAPTASSSGGGSYPMPPPGSTAPVPGPAPSAVDAGQPMGGCGCTPSTTNHCTPQVVNCTANAQCPTGWTCRANGPAGGACGVPILPDGGIGQVMCEPAPPPTMQCMPPYIDVIGRYYANDSGSLGAALPPQGQFGGTTTGAAGSAGATSGAPVPGAPAPGAGGATGETAGTPKTSTPGATPSASSGDSGGCQVGHGGTNAGASLFALLGLVGLSRRRSRRLV